MLSKYVIRECYCISNSSAEFSPPNPSVSHLAEAVSVMSFGWLSPFPNPTRHLQIEGKSVLHVGVHRTKRGIVGF